MRVGHVAVAVAAAVAPGVVVSCATPGGKEADKLFDARVDASVVLHSEAFDDATTLPVAFTCDADGEGESPPLEWGPGPAGTEAWAVVVDDPDVAVGTYVHWVILIDDPTVTALGAGDAPDHSVQAKNSKGLVGYQGPCPPRGATHTYRVAVYALDTSARGIPDGVQTNSALRFVRGAAIARGVLTATYGR